MPPRLLDFLYVFAALAYLPVLVYQALVLKKSRGGWGERFGDIPLRTGDRLCVWVHAVSLGEVNATRSLVAELKKRRADIDIVISATTDTGLAAARSHYPDLHVFRYPLDFSFVVRRVLGRIRPDAVVLMELEVWPNFIELCAGRGIPVGVANGRVTEEKSMRRFGRPVIRGIARRMMSRLAFVGVQNETYAARFRRLGALAGRIHVTGNLKYDTAVIADDIPGAAAVAEAMGIARGPAHPLVVAGSTGPGEEVLLLDAFTAVRRHLPGAQLAIVPRKPERFDEVARLIESHGFCCRRRTNCPDGAHPTQETVDRPVVLLGDTMGELRKFYSLAGAVFVGRSLVPLGGSDPIEVAALARPMCYGPHMENFADAAAELESATAVIRLESAQELAPALLALIRQEGDVAGMGVRAREVVRRNIGATGRTADLILALLPGMATAQHAASNLENAATVESR